MKKDYINNVPEAERRFGIPEVRSDEGSRKFSGLGIVYNKLSENFAPGMEGGFYELIEPGAARGLLEDPDIMILFNHSENLVIGRNTTTATLTETNDGVIYEGEAANTTVGNDFLENLRLKNIRKSSFAFTVKEERDEKIDWPELGIINLRRIVSFKKLFDFSPVTYPAYADTTVALRKMLSLSEGDPRKQIFRKHQIFALT